MATKSDFTDWKQNPVTKEVMKVIQQRITALQEELGSNAGTDSLFDRYRVGAIGAYTDLLNIDFEETDA